jgi:3-deoxy-D-manno-octulosonate 8-phosphate phosphatase KdsC-like HAD superfamily phosphatase
LIRDPDAPDVARETWTVKLDAKVVASFTDAYFSHAVKIVGVSDDLDLVVACEKVAQNTLGEKASAARSQPYYLDVTHPVANKGTVVATLSKHLGIPPEQIATIGDMQNDVLMFRKSGFSIAMGNSSDEVKAQASAVTDSKRTRASPKQCGSLFWLNRAVMTKTFKIGDRVSWNSEAGRVSGTVIRVRQRHGHPGAHPDLTILPSTRALRSSGSGADAIIAKRDR